MKERKYKEDWVNETRFDAKGNEKRVPVYRGPLFSLPSGPEKRNLLLYSLLPWAALLALLLGWFGMDFPGTRVLYVFLPAGLILFPCLYWAMGIFAVLRVPQKMTRVQKETGIGRVLRSAAACLILCGAALLGECVFLLSGGNPGREWPGMLMLLAAAVLASGTVARFRAVSRRLSEERSAGP